MFTSFPSAMVLQCAEGLIWGGRESQRPLPESKGPGESQQSPEGQGEEHETSLEAGQTWDQRASSKLQTASRSWTRVTTSTTGHHPGSEIHSQENPAQKSLRTKSHSCIGRNLITENYSVLEDLD